MKRKPTELDSGGFRIAWLIPLEALAYGSVLTIGMKYGFWITVPLVFLPFFVILKKIADRELKIVGYWIDDWLTDIEKAEQQGLEAPELGEAYAILETKPQKTKVAKRRLLGPSSSFKQIKMPNGSPTKKPTFQSV